MSKHIGSCFRIPQLHTQHEVTGECFRSAITNLTETNTVPCDFNVYNKTGLLVPDHPYMIQAGVAYGTPWIRDASINIWNCARIIEPEISRNTLFAVCLPDKFGRPVIQEPDDNGFEQSWDKIIWAIGAWTYFLSTGDMPFLKTAFDIINRSLDDLRYYKLNIKFGLFTGGSFFNDGIAGYPHDLYDSSIASSFAPDHPRIRSIMCLSTNCIYCEAYRILYEMAIVFHDSTCAEKAKAHHAALKENINKHFWNPKIGRYDYIVYPDGKKDTSQEESGNTFAVLFSICPNELKKNILSNLKTEKYGMVSISPPFEGLFSKEHPGRHCNLIWPFLNSFYIRAAAENKQLDIVTDELRKFSTLVENSGYTFFEVYNPYTGKPDGGWQLATHWPSVPDQTWSATGYIASIIHGIFGISIQKDGISIFPCVPEYMRDSQLCNIVIRNITLSITTKQYGARIKRCRINHEIVNDCFIPFSSESQNYFIELEMEP